MKEESIKERKKLKGYEVVRYNNGYRLSVGNPQVFPIRKVAETYKRNYESYPWFKDDAIIEEVEYEGVPIGEYVTYNGKEVVDREHYFGLAACEIGDYFTEDLVEDFINMLPPVYMTYDCVQIGEPSTNRMDEDGIIQATYGTFQKIDDGIWEYCGDCFEGEGFRHGMDVPYV